MRGRACSCFRRPRCSACRSSAGRLVAAPPRRSSDRVPSCTASVRSCCCPGDHVAGARGLGRWRRDRPPIGTALGSARRSCSASGSTTPAVSVLRPTTVLSHLARIGASVVTARSPAQRRAAVGLAGAWVACTGRVAPRVAACWRGRADRLPPLSVVSPCAVKLCASPAAANHKVFHPESRGFVVAVLALPAARAVAVSRASRRGPGVARRRRADPALYLPLPADRTAAVHHAPSRPRYSLPGRGPFSRPGPALTSGSTASPAAWCPACCAALLRSRVGLPERQWPGPGGLLLVVLWAPRTFLASDLVSSRFSRCPVPMYL